MAGPRSLRAEQRPRLHPALLPPSPDGLRPGPRGSQAVSPVGLQAPPATPSAATRPGSRSPPARSDRAWPTPSGWRSPSASWPTASTGPGMEIVDHRTWVHLLRRRPDGGHLPGGGLDRWPLRPRQAHPLLRRQPHHDRRHDGAVLRRRGSPARASRPTGWHVQRVHDSEDTDALARGAGGAARRNPSDPRSSPSAPTSPIRRRTRRTRRRRTVRRSAKTKFARPRRSWASTPTRPSSSTSASTST